MALSGLVSYGSSDSENESDNETETAVITKTVLGSPKPGTSKSSESYVKDAINDDSVNNIENNLDNLIDDDAIDDGPIVGPAVPTGLGLPKPKYTEDDEDDETINENEKNMDGVTSALSKLPKATVSKSELAESLDDVVEEEYKKLPKNVELPKPSKKAGKVKITLPSLPDADSDEDEPKAKKPRPTPCGKSGLIGLLPQPKHFSVKETNRPLIPHTVTSKKPAPPKPKPNVAPRKPAKSLVDVASDSDDEDEGASFFSFAPKTDKSSAAASGISVKAAPLVSPSVRHEEPEEPAEKPLEFASGKSTQSNVSQNWASHQYPGPSPIDTNEPVYNSDSDYNSTAYSNMETEYSCGPSSSTIDFETHQKLLQDEQFKRICGKDFRGEELQIMDVNAGDQMSSQIDITKSLTEEKSDMSYSKKRKDLPSSLSRRKHQITYLAFQAKERELELKNQWSQNKMTKRQTQAKYGF